MNQGKFLNENVLRAPRAVITFPHLFEPSAMDGEPAEKAKYSVVLVWDNTETDFTLINQLIAKQASSLSGPATRQTLRNGIEKLHLGEPFGEGVTFATASTFRPPVVVLGDRTPARPSDVVSGSYCNAVLHTYSYDKKGNRGVSLGLSAIQLLGGGKRIEPTIDPTSAFDVATTEPIETEGNEWD